VHVPTLTARPLSYGTKTPGLRKTVSSAVVLALPSAPPSFTMHVDPMEVDAVPAHVMVTEQAAS
jgi:hypothetical protein